MRQHPHTYMMYRRRGSVLVPLAAIAGVIAMLGVTMLTLGYHTRTRAIDRAHKLGARVAADAGLTQAIHTFRAEFTDGSLRIDALPSSTNTVMANFEGTYTYSIQANTSSRYTITCTGSYGGAQRHVEATLDMVGATHDHAIFAQQEIVLNNSAVVDRYNDQPGDDPLSIATNSTDSGAIELKNSSYVDGNILVGAGGDPLDVVKNRGGEVTGTASAQASNWSLPPVVVPDALAIRSPLGDIDRTQTIAASGKYQAINLGNSETLTIASDVELYIAGDVTLGNSAEIRIEEGCSLALYVDGKIEGKNSSKFNNTTEDPLRLRILGTESCDKIVLKNSGDMYAVVYAPEAEAILHNSATVWGSITADVCELKNSGTVHYDASLRTRQDNALAALKMTSWREY